MAEWSVAAVSKTQDRSVRVHAVSAQLRNSSQMARHFAPNPALRQFPVRSLAGCKSAVGETANFFWPHLARCYRAESAVIFVGSSARVSNVTPAVTPPQLLCSPDTIAVTPR